MYPRLFQIYGPLWINSYGLFIAIGFLIFSYLTYRHPLRRKLISNDCFINTLLIGLLAGIIGGRLLFVLISVEVFAHNLWEILYPWIGGFSVIGSILGVIIVVPVYLRMHQVQILPFFDVVGLYAPILQAISRIGCFFAGCCYGLSAPEGFPFAVTFTHPDSLAPLNISLHPTQLYYTFFSLLLFVLLWGISKRCFPIPGTLFFVYLIGESFVRFFSEFWRADCQPLSHPLLQFVSAYQVWALLIMFGAISGLVILHTRK